MATSAGSPVQGPRPVFVFPGSLDFYLEDQSTHKRVLTLYNPYDVDILFKVLCNNPKKYAVVEPEGRILGQKCVDIVVRHVAVSPVAVQQTDKFRIHIYDSASSDAEVAGKRDILATLHPGRQMPASGSSNPKTKYTSCDRSRGVPDPMDKHGTSLPHRPGSTASILPPSDQGPQGWDTNSPYSSSMIHEHQHPNYIACFAAIVCIAALFLPTEGEESFADYPYLQLTVNQKLVFAYVLGLVTMAILRAT